MSSSPATTNATVAHSESKTGDSMGFELSLDPSDPLNFLMPDSHSGDSSFEDTSSSTHDSPGEWQPSWPDQNQYGFDTFQAPGQKDFKWPYNTDGSFNPGMDLDFDPSAMLMQNASQMLNFEPSLFAQTGFPMNPELPTVQTDNSQRLSSQPFMFALDPSHADPSGRMTQLSTEFRGGARRLSITSQSSLSSSSASGSSNSPNLGHMAPIGVNHETNQTRTSGDVTMDDLANRARQVVGVVMAIPAAVEAEQTQTPFSNTNPSQPSKLPIPRLLRPAVASTNTAVKRKSAANLPSPPSSLASTPPPPSPSSSLQLQSSPEPSVNVQASQSKPKTSHTTIERRYRTNLNARIQSLRNAVPALRVLEVKDGNRVGNLGLKAGTKKLCSGMGHENVGNGEEDVVDERGFVDGVKVARKGSKANVLGKAVEYIRVLKKRELRLKREQDGLKSLLCGLIGGPALLQEWEREWRAMFGGPETDEVEGDEREDADDEGEMDDEDDEDDEDGEGGAGKKRKRAKADGVVKPKKEATAKRAAIASTTPTGPQPPQEKRKRGRPRKVFPVPEPVQAVIAPLTVAADAEMTNVQPQGNLQEPPSIQLDQRPAPPGQYLLAAFALFSFFNSPGSLTMRRQQSGEHVHTHSGSVLGSEFKPLVTFATASATGFEWRDVIPVVHMTISALLLCSVVMPYIPRTISKRMVATLPSFIAPFFGLQPVPPTHHKKTDEPVDQGEPEDFDEEQRSRAALVDALKLRFQFYPPGSTESRTQEIQALRDALGVRGGLPGLTSAIAKLAFGLITTSKSALEMRMLEQRAWMRLCEVIALTPTSSWITRLQAYLCASKYLSPFAATPSDVATLALLVYPFWSSKGASLWGLARSRINGVTGNSTSLHQPFEKFVLETMDIEAAVDHVSSMVSVEPSRDSHSENYEERAGNQDSIPVSTYSPIGVLASLVVRQHIRKQAENVFMQSVLGEATTDESEISSSVINKESVGVIAAGRSLDARTITLVELFEKVCNPAWSHLSQTITLEDTASERRCQEDAEIATLLHAIVLYRRIFPSTLLHVPVSGDKSSASYHGSTTGTAPAAISISLIPMPSPPPSPSRKNAALHLALRRVLDSSAFDQADGLEDARDRVVDLLTSSEAARWPTCSHF